MVLALFYVFVFGGDLAADVQLAGLWVEVEGGYAKGEGCLYALGKGGAGGGGFVLDSSDGGGAEEVGWAD